MIPQAPTPEEWLAVDPDPVTRAELQQLIDSGDQAGIDDRFGDRLRFGTAGIRGPMGAGPNRMNRVVVRQTAAALAIHVGPGAKVVIGFDARQNSDVFAQDVASVLAAAGCHPMMLPPKSPTPVLAFAVTHLGADAGVMVTASHNPAGDNGIKVYLDDGAQIIPPHDQAIEAAIASQPLPPLDLPLASPEKVDVSAEYMTAILANVAIRGPFHPLAYTPLQGVGLPPTQSSPRTNQQWAPLRGGGRGRARPAVQQRGLAQP